MSLNLTEFMDNLPLGMLVILCLTLGLAPFNPPHIWEKLQMLTRGQLIKPLDWFDFFLHGTPWILLIFKVGYILRNR